MSVRKDIQLKSDVQISDLFEKAPAQLLLAGPLSVRQPIGENRRKTLTHMFLKTFSLPGKLIGIFY